MNKNRFISFILSVIMIITLIPSLAFAMANPYATPSWNPGSTPHPRVMFTSSDISTIKENIANTTQNAQAAYYFSYTIQNSSLRTTSISLSSSVDSETGTNADFKKEGEIEMFALFYALYANDPEYASEAETCANIAITRMQEYLNAYKCNTNVSMAYRNIGCTIFHASEVFDWCYNYPGFTQSKKDAMINSIENLVKKLDVWDSSENAPIDQSAITSHGSENQILRDLLAFGIATAGHTTSGGSSRNDIYNAVMGRIQADYVAPRNYLYQSSTTHQGSEYGWYRFYFDLYAEKLYETAASQSNTPPKTLFNTDDMKEVLYGMIYSRRPDGRFFVEGDNKHTDYWYYNNFNRHTAKFAGDLFADPYFKGEYRMMCGSEGTATDLSSNVFSSNTNFYDDRSFNAVQWLIMNNPDVSFYTQSSRQAGLAPSRYFGSPIGKIYARTRWEFSRENPNNNMAAAAEMKIGEQYSGNHDHLDAGTFQLYYRGLLSGDYGAETDYGDNYDSNYYKRTVAHNAITIDSGSVGFNYDIGTFASLKNDGGQLGGAETNNFSTWKNNAPYKRASVVNHDIASDNSYSYIKGDITNAYGSSKASEVARSMAFLPTGNAYFPAVMVVFDKVTSKSNSQTKKFLLHTAAEPTVTDNNRVYYENSNTLTYSNGSAEYGGRLLMNTLLPASATITKVAGTQVNGNSYTGQTDSKFEPEWGRVEVQAASEGTTTKFLNVLTLSCNTRTPQDATIIGSEGDTLVGARIKDARTENNNTPYDMVAMFADTGAGSLTSQASFTVSGSDTGIKYFIFGVDEGVWTVIKDDTTVIGAFDVDEDAGTIAFTADAGKITVRPYQASDMMYDTVAWYDARRTDGSSANSSAATWTDLSNNNNDLALNIQANQTFWNGEGNDLALRIIGNSGNVTALPAAVKDTINTGKFTLEFAVKMNAEKGDLVSIFGNSHNGFAIYKIMNANKIYMKTPGTKTFINRPYWQLWNDEYADGEYGVSNHHCIITVDTTQNGGNGEMKWYLDGKLVTISNYNNNNSESVINLVSETGKRVDYKQIKVLSRAIGETEAQAEYEAYRDGTF